MNSSYKIRASLIFIFFCSLYLLILGNLYSIQIKQRNFFVNLGKHQYNVTITSAPERALIYDRNDQPSALNRYSLSAFIMPKKIESIEKLEPFLKKHFPQALKRLYKHPDAHFLYVKRKLTNEQINLITTSQIADIKLLKEPNRFYPIESAGHIIGITDVDNIGQFGIEMIFNEQLSGIPATYSLEKDARSGHFYFTRTTKVEETEGKSVKLTIDTNLQFLVHEHLKETVSKYHAQEGAVLVMNPENGEILAMAQYPAFDPNNTEAINLNYTKNKSITDVHELGSVMKVFVALASLQEGIVAVDELINCENTKTALVHGVRVNTVYAHGIIPFCEVIQYSNNIGIAKIALRLGPKLYDHYKKLGFGKKTGINWPGEQTGFVNPPKNWSKPSIISLSFGYEITANLLQLAQAFALIANGGYLVKPKILFSDSYEYEKKEQLYDKVVVDTIGEILEKTVTQGTARRAALKGYRVMGKTGTANIVIDGNYNPDHNRYTFAGILQKGDYKRVIVTFIQDAAFKNLYASQVAAPLFEKVAESVLINDKII